MYVDSLPFDLSLKSFQAKCEVTHSWKVLSETWVRVALAWATHSIDALEPELAVVSVIGGLSVRR